jgi:Transglycosylase SLT domain
MRPLLALAILLIGMRGAAPEAKYQDSIRASGASPLAAAFKLDVALDPADRAYVVALPPIESSDAAHDQDEEATAPLSPAPVSTDAAADADLANSLEGLCTALMRSAQDNDLPVPFFANLIWQESHLQHDAVSPVGAQGIAQFMPEVAAAEGVGDPFDPHQAIPASARLLRTLRQHFGNLGFAAAAYNAGPRRVGEWLDKRRALPLETRTYVLRVTGRTIEAWRKSPVGDSRLTFVRVLPCRELPAFAELEQAQLQDTEHEEERAEHAQPSPPKLRQAKIAAKTGVKIVAKATPKTSPLPEREAILSHPPDADHKARPQVAQAAKIGVMARNFHTGKHEAIRRQHAPHEKRRIA